MMSILSIFNLAVLVIPTFDPIIKGVVGIMDSLITIIFMADFLYRFFSAESKIDYFFRNWGWADLLASMPGQQMKIFRIFRIFKVVRLFRTFGVRRMLYEIRDNRAGSALYMTVFLVIMVLEFGGASMVYIEAPAPHANIAGPADAVWWALVTITTIGYGDKYPVTNTGRLIGMFVMILGVGLFGVLTGFLANAFLAPKEQEEKNHDAVASGETGNQVEEFRRLIEVQEQTNAALKEKLEEIELLLEAQA